MIRAVESIVRRSFILAVVLWVCSIRPAGAQDGGPTQLEIKIWEQAQQYLSDCSAYPDASADAAACEKSRMRFSVDYYEALTGNVDDQFAMSYMFTQASPPSAVMFSPILGCAWMIVFDDSGGDPQAGPDEPTVAAGCRNVPAAALAAQAIEAEMANIKNTGSP